MPPSRRKKWTEAEERTLIDKYGEMVSNGSLSKMKTREKKFKPIALHVNSVHHSGDPIGYPFEWSWKDVSNKVQNMRHQYSLVKQKIKRSNCDGFDWVEGLTHWSNFLRYKEVFGDVNVNFPLGEDGGFDEGNLVEFANLEFDYEDHLKEDNGDNNGFVYAEIEPMGSETKKKRKAVKGFEKKAWGFVANQLTQLKIMEARLEQQEEDHERERRSRESLTIQTEQERENERENRRKQTEQRLREWEEAMDREDEDRKRRRDEERAVEEKWEERINRRRSEWKARIDAMLSQHRAEMVQAQARILHEQQNVTGQLLGLVSQWTGHPSGLSDNGNANGHYLSQMMQNLQHVGDAQVEGHNQDDEFIVDG